MDQLQRQAIQAPPPPTTETVSDDVIRWAEREFWIPERRGPVTLAPYQRAALREARRRGADGAFVYSTVLWSDIKKSAKSTIAAAVALHTGLTVPWAQVIVIANDLKQADSRVGYYARRAIEGNPRLAAQCKVRNYSIDMPEHARLECVPIDPTGEAGSNADLIVFSELWGAHQQAQRRMWAEMTLSPTKFGQSQRWIETYAGYSGESELLEQLYQQGVKQGRRLTLPDAPDGLEVYANDAARLFTLWNTVPRLTWQTGDYYAQEQAVLTPGEFQRLHRNQWVSSTESFVPAEWWDACRGAVPALGQRDMLVIGVDAGVVSDTFAVTAVSRDGARVHVRYARKWSAPPGGKVDFQEPEAEIRRLCAEYNVAQLAYDSYQLEDMAARLARDGVAWVSAFSQAGDRLVADNLLRTLIRERRITHSGEPDLREHVLNANAKTEGDKLRIVKRSEMLKVDLCVALSMATARSMELNL